MKRRLDPLDKALIGTLFADGRLAVSEIAARLSVSAPTVRGRLRGLLGAGVLRVAGLVDASQTPELTTAIVGLSLDRFNLDEMVERLAALDEVNWAAVVTGRYDIIAEVVTTEGMGGLYGFLNVSLQKLGGVQSSEMFVVMKASHKWMLLPPAMSGAWTSPDDNGAQVVGFTIGK
jgi:Lrp/AsnC family transcriptional regulator for asnA, asnC and gidA